MFVTVTAKYDSADKVRNAKDDLLATGIPAEKVFVDADAMQIKVMTPEVTKAEILELLNRHEPTQIG